MHIIIAQYLAAIDLQKVKMFRCKLSETFLYLDGKTVRSQCKRLRKAFDDPMLELHLSFLFVKVIGNDFWNVKSKY